MHGILKRRWDWGVFFPGLLLPSWETRQLKRETRGLPLQTICGLTDGFSERSPSITAFWHTKRNWRSDITLCTDALLFFELEQTAGEEERDGVSEGEKIEKMRARENTTKYVYDASPFIGHFYYLNWIHYFTVRSLITSKLTLEERKIHQLH